MIDLNDLDARQKLINKYVEAETSIEEEQCLTDFYQQEPSVWLPNEETIAHLLHRQTSQSSPPLPGDEKDESELFDRLITKPLLHHKT